MLLLLEVFLRGRESPAWGDVARPRDACRYPLARVRQALLDVLARSSENRLERPFRAFWAACSGRTKSGADWEFEDGSELELDAWLVARKLSWEELLARASGRPVAAKKKSEPVMTDEQRATRAELLERRRQVKEREKVSQVEAARERRVASPGEGSVP